MFCDQAASYEHQYRSMDKWQNKQNKQKRKKERKKEKKKQTHTPWAREIDHQTSTHAHAHTRTFT